MSVRCGAPRNDGGFCTHLLSPDGVCRVSSHGYRGLGSGSAWREAPPRPPTLRQRVGRAASEWSDRSILGVPADRWPAAAVGLTALDVLVLVFLVAPGRGPSDAAGTVTAWAVFFVPAALAAVLMSRCGAWRRDGLVRCTQLRRGLFRRCADHKATLVTAFDVAGAVVLLAASYAAVTLLPAAR